jgi:hypothetical protein
MGSNRFWHIVSVVKERLASLSSRVASSEPIKNSILSDFVNTPFRSFFLFHKIPQPRLYLFHSAPGSFILRRAVGASHERFLKSSLIRGDDVNPGELRLLQLTSFLHSSRASEPIVPAYSASLG